MSETKRYRQKMQEIEAFVWDGEEIVGAGKLTWGNTVQAKLEHRYEKRLYASKGDYIIKDEDGMYAMVKEQFEQTFEEVE